MSGIYRDKVAIVTGGASGIGEGLCEGLGRQGARVVVADINGEGAEAVASRIVARGGRARPARLDVSREEEVRALVDGTVATDGRLDLIFNNAGLALFADARDVDLDTWRRLIDVNLWGVIYGTLHAYRVMVEQGTGHIVNTASVAGLVPTPMVTAYATTKHAIVGLSTSLREEGAALGVRVSVVCPGMIRTGMVETAQVVNADRQALLDHTPVRFMEAGRAAAAILQGVARNRDVIAFPPHARLLRTLHRFAPPLLNLLGRKSVADFRAEREKTLHGTDCQSQGRDVQ